MKGNGLPIACNLTGAGRDKRRTETARLFEGSREVEELADGYAFRYPGDDG